MGQYSSLAFTSEQNILHFVRIFLSTVEKYAVLLIYALDATKKMSGTIYQPFGTLFLTSSSQADTGWHSGEHRGHCRGSQIQSHEDKALVE